MNKIRIRLKAYDHILLDKSTEKIVRTAKETGALVLGPIPLPTKKTIITVNRSVFVDKKSREQFQIKTHKGKDGGQEVFHFHLHLLHTVWVYLSAAKGVE